MLFAILSAPQFLAGVAWTVTLKHPSISYDSDCF